MAGAHAEDDQAQVNAAIWARAHFLDEYAHLQLRAPEVLILVRHREALSGRVLELGFGAGRFTWYPAALGAEVFGIDVSPAMVEHTRALLPEADLRQGDMADLSGFQAGSFSAVVAACNIIDVLDAAGRRRLLEDIRELLAPDGLLVMSSHNRAHVPFIRRPRRVRTSDPLRLAADLVRMAADPTRGRREARNRRRLASLQRQEADYAIVNDPVYEYSLLHYYVTRDAQERQFAELGFALEECLDLDGATVPAGADAASSIELHYVARRR